MAARARITGKRVSIALAELEDAGTCAIRSDGAWGFVNFGRWQETADAAYKRRVRGQSTGQSTGQSGRKSVACPPLVEVEAEGEGEQSIEPFGFSPSDP